MKALLFCVVLTLGIYVPLQPVLRRVSGGSSALTNIQNVLTTQMQYVGSVYLGTPAQEFVLLFDSASSVRARQWLWIPRQDCQVRPTEHLFSPQESTTYRDLGINYTLSYGLGEANGRVSSERLSFGQNCTAQDQVFLLICDDQNFEWVQADGIIGLSFPKLSNGYSTSILTLKEQGVIDYAVFAIYLNDANQASDVMVESNIMIGEYNYKKYAWNEPVWVNVYAESGYWAARLNTVKLGDEAVPDSSRSSIVALVDTGSSLILAPADELKQLHRLFGPRCTSSNNELRCDCSQGLDYPELELELGGYFFTVPASSYFIQVDDVCLLLIASLGKKNFWVLGAVFLRNYYTIFDMDNERVGFAE